MWLSIIGRCTFVIQTASLRLKLPTNATMMSGMDSNIVGLLISFPFLALIIALAIALKKWCAISSESMRKFIHIGVSNWWFILLLFFNTLSYALIGPILFILLNSLFTFLDWGSALGLSDRKRNWGLIYFPVTLVILTILQYQGLVRPLSTTIGVLVMGYGDGLAALVGAKWGKREIPFNVSKKSYLGTVTMFAVSLVIITVALCFFSDLSPLRLLLIALSVAFISAVVELLTPFGLDNLTVPLLATLLIEVLV